MLPSIPSLLCENEEKGARPIGLAGEVWPWERSGGSLQGGSRGWSASHAATQQNFAPEQGHQLITDILPALEYIQ